MRNSALQVFKGGWQELENAVKTDNKGSVTLPEPGFIGGEFIKPDGTVIFASQNNVSFPKMLAYQLSVPWDIDSVASTPFAELDLDETNPFGIFFKFDGTSAYYLNGGSPRAITQIPLGTPWDITSAGAEILVNINGLVDGSRGLAISTTGDKIFITDNSGHLHESNVLGTPWDITDITSFGQFTPTGASSLRGVTFSPTGNKMYLGDVVVDRLQEFDLPVFFATTLAGGDAPQLVTTFTMINPAGLQIRPNGLQLFEFDGGTNTNRFEIPVQFPFDISKMSIFDISLSIPNSPRAVTWKPDGSKFLVIKNSDDEISEWDTAFPWNLNGAVEGLVSSDVGPGGLGLDDTPQGMFWRPDGMKCWFVGTQFNTIYELDAATPWSSNGLTDSGVSRILNGTPTGIWFSPDGLRLYESNTLSGGVIRQYGMSTPYDIVNMVAGPSLLVGTNAGSPRDVFFSPDERNMYIPSNDEDAIVRYRFSISKDVSSGAFVDFLDVTTDGVSPQGVFIRGDDGKRIYAVDGGANSIYMYYMDSEFNTNILTGFGDDLIDNVGDDLVFA